MAAQPSEPLLVVEEEVSEPRQVKTVSRSRLVLRRFLRRKLATVGLIIIVLFFLFAFVGIHLTTWKYTDLDPTAIYQPPSATHWFGTTAIGADMYANTMRGLQKSLLIGIVGALIATAIAAMAGAAAGYFGRNADRFVIVLIDLLLVLPSFLILAVLSPLFQGETWLVFVVLLAAFQWMLTARVVRGLTQSLKEREFVSAARFMGVSPWKIIVHHILPNMASFLIIDATLNVSSLILAEVSLSFFGFGVRPPDVSLGTLIFSGINTPNTPYAYLFWIPAVVLVILVLAVNLVGDGVRDALDPNSEISGSR